MRTTSALCRLFLIMIPFMLCTSGCTSLLSPGTSQVVPDGTVSRWREPQSTSAGSATAEPPGPPRVPNSFRASEQGPDGVRRIDYVSMSPEAQARLLDDLKYLQDELVSLHRQLRNLTIQIEEKDRILQSVSSEMKKSESTLRDHRGEMSQVRTEVIALQKQLQNMELENIDNLRLMIKAIERLLDNKPEQPSVNQASYREQIKEGIRLLSSLEGK